MTKTTVAELAIQVKSLSSNLKEHAKENREDFKSVNNSIKELRSFIDEKIDKMDEKYVRKEEFKTYQDNIVNESNVKRSWKQNWPVMIAAAVTSIVGVFNMILFFS